MHERQHGYDHANPTHAPQLDDEAPKHRHASSLAAPAHPIASGLLQRKADANGVASHAEAAVSSAQGSSGSALPGMLMRKFESSLGADLSDVRVHTGSESAAAASAVGARAYTMGQDIHFGAGQYDPSSGGGEHLIAHEVAHTVQQRGGSPTRQNKLEVSGPADAHEHEADRAADAMVRGAPAAVSTMSGIVARKATTDPSTGDLQGAGDEAQAKAWAKPLQVDTLNVQTDRSRVGELVADIDKQQKVIEKATKEDPGIEASYGPLATNTATKAKLNILNDKLDVSNVDTAAFGSQYRYAYADYQRLVAEATEYMTLTNRSRPGDKVDAVSVEHEDANLKLVSTAARERFRVARTNLNSGAVKMDAQLTRCRGAANRLQGSVYRARAAAAAATGAEAAKKLVAVNKEIADVAGGVSQVVKICSAVGGLAGGGGATAAIGTAKAGAEAPSAEIAPSKYAEGLGFKGTNVDLAPEEASKAALAKAIGGDIAGVFGGGGGPDKMAEALVTAIGKYANREKIGKLQNEITKAASEEASFKAAGDGLAMVADQQELEAESKGLQTLQKSFVLAKAELRDAGEELMAALNKGGGAKGKQQARAVMFLTDADRFLAQVETAISAGKNQQENLKLAANDRKSLRGTSAANGEAGVDGKEQATAKYYRCTELKTKGVLWGENTQYKLDRVWVQFNDNGTLHQGGKGTIEGAGSVDDEVAHKIETLKAAKAQVQKLQSNLQSSLGLGAPQING